MNKTLEIKRTLGVNLSNENENIVNRIYNYYYDRLQSGIIFEKIENDTQTFCVIIKNINKTVNLNNFYSKVKNNVKYIETNINFIDIKEFNLQIYYYKEKKHIDINDVTASKRGYIVIKEDKSIKAKLKPKLKFLYYNIQLKKIIESFCCYFQGTCITEEFFNDIVEYNITESNKNNKFIAIDVNIKNFSNKCLLDSLYNFVNTWRGKYSESYGTLLKDYRIYIEPDSSITFWFRRELDNTSNIRTMNSSKSKQFNKV